MKKTWRAANIHNMQVRYGTWAEEFKGYDDDRAIYVKLYNQIIEALESLPEEPLPYIRVAMWRQMAKDKEMLNRIAARFGD